MLKFGWKEKVTMKLWLVTQQTQQSTDKEKQWLVKEDIEDVGALQGKSSLLLQPSTDTKGQF